MIAVFLVETPLIMKESISRTERRGSLKRHEDNIIPPGNENVIVYKTVQRKKKLPEYRGWARCDSNT